MRQDLLTKNGIAVRMLAREFLSLKPNDRIDTIGEYAQKFDLGRGTIQTALRYLEDNKAIELDSRGHLGTFILKLEYKKLWTSVGFSNISGVMPLPYSKRYEGLATGLYKVFATENIPFNLAYVRGGERRLEDLQNEKYDFAIMSRLAATANIEAGKDVKIIIDFGANSYVSSHRIIFADNNKTQIEDGMKVALDPKSIDHLILTRHECQDKNVTFVELAYNQIISSILSRELDAAVWNYDEIQDHGLVIKNEPLRSKEAQDIEGSNTRAVLVVMQNNWGVEKIINRVLNKEKVIKIQTDVILNRILPEY